MKGQKKVPVAIQLYSLRTVTPADLAGTLKKVAGMGYEGVEFAGYYDLPAKTLRKMLDDCGLKSAGAHVGLDALDGDAFEKTVAVNKELGNDRLIVPWADMKELPSVIARLNAAHARAKKCGMKVGYHNHTGEFELENGVTALDRLLAGTAADFLAQIDIGWAAAAGQDLAALLRKHGKRIETVHVKEYDRNNKKAEVGNGEIKWPAVFDVLEKETAVKWYIVEQEDYAVGPLESARVCIENIRKAGR